MQPSSPRETCGERLPNAAIAGLNMISIPDLSIERFNHHFKASEVNWIATLQAGPPFTPILLSDVPIAPIPTPSVQPITHQKKKRNQKTREHYKKKKAQAYVTIQEMKYVPKVRICVKKAPSKHVALKRTAPRDWIATSLHVIVSWVRVPMMDGMVMIFRVDEMSRLGVG